jgi:hypothetical protein
MLPTGFELASVMADVSLIGTFFCHTHFEMNASR